MKKTYSETNCLNPLCRSTFIPSRANQKFCSTRCSKRAWQINMRNSVIQLYGGKCACCGEANLAFLTIEHINGDGHLERKALNGGGATSLYLRLHNKPKRGDLEVLCQNCNTSRYHNRLFGGKCQHEIDRELGNNALTPKQESNNEPMVPAVSLDEIFVRED